MSLEQLATICKSDILIIGHGIAGVYAALTIKEKNPDADILLVDKASTGWAGKANKGGCCQFTIAPGHTAEEIVEFHVRHTGEFLNDQEAYLDFVRHTPLLLEKLEEWGIVIPRDEEGRIKFSGGVHAEDWPAPWALIGYEADFMVKLTNLAKKKGCRFMDKIAVTDLLTHGNKVAGAAGFSLLDGEKFIFKATAVVIANGNQDYRAMNMWACARGDGIAAAWRAGVDMRNGEFGSFRQIGAVDGATWEMVTSEDNLYNAKGEYISPKYRPWLATPEGRARHQNAMILDSNAAAYVGMYQEIMDGKGPIYANQNENTMGEIFFKYAMNQQWWNRPKYLRFRLANVRVEEECNISAKDGMVPVTAAFVGEQSPIKVNHDMATSMDGLWAIGDACYNGSGIAGAVPGPPARLRGSGIAFAEYSAYKAGQNIAEYIKTAAGAPVAEEQAQAIFDRVFAPLERKLGVDPMEIVRNIRRLMTRVEYSTYMSAQRIAEALELVHFEQSKLDKMCVSDFHYLSAANEARSMVTCAEIHFRTAALREESRGWFMREDFPQRDDENWLKMINFRNNGAGEFDIWYEDVPLASYPYQNDGKVVTI